MRETRTYGSEGREPGNSTGLPYPYRESPIYVLTFSARGRNVGSVTGP